MPHPYANRSVKCAFRWYHRSNLRARRLSQCADLQECPRPLLFPQSQILPFQIFAGNDQDGTYGQSAPMTWVIKNMAGTVVFDMAAFIPLLVVEQFTGTTPSFNRDYIILDLPITVPFAFAEGATYESEITTVGGTYYSETFTFVCAKFGDNLLPSPIAIDEICDQWSYFPWAGMVAGVVADNGALPVSPPTSSDWICLDDGLIYSFNGVSYDTNPGGEGNYYSAGICEPIYTWHLGTWSVVPPGINAPFDVTSICWHLGAEIPVGYNIGAFVAGETLVRLNLNLFYGSAFSGSMEIYVDNVLVYTYDSANNGQGVEIDVVIDTDSTIEFRPLPGYQGCLTQFEMRSLSGGIECYHKLTWSDCGDVGTNRYLYRDFTNILYLDARKDKLVYPTVTFKVRNRTDTTEGDIPEVQRKDVRWELEFERGVPWYLLDALTEIPLHRTVTLQLANEDNADALENVEVSGTWPKPDACLADCTFTFQLDEPTFKTGCCDGMDPACIEPCVNADGGLISVHFDFDPGQIGQVFLADDGTYATYWGLDQEEHVVDEFGFGAYTRCESGMATTPLAGYETVYYTGTEWFNAVYITDVVVIDCERRIFNISGNVMAQYGVRVQWSDDGGSTWNNIGPAFTSDEIGSGVDIEFPDNAYQYRLTLVGGEDCVVASSLSKLNKCTCITFNVSPGALFGSGTFTPNEANLDLPSLNETLLAEYRLNGGSWVALGPLEATSGLWAWNGTLTYTPGDLIEIQSRVLSQVDCAVSLESFQT